MNEPIISLKRLKDGSPVWEITVPADGEDHHDALARAESEALEVWRSLEQRLAVSERAQLKTRRQLKTPRQLNTTPEEVVRDAFRAASEEVD